MLRTQLEQQKASQQAYEKATEFTIKLVPEQGKPVPSFDQIAKAEGLPVQQTGWLAGNEMAPGMTTPDFSLAAFKLEPENPVSDPVPGPKSIYVLHLLERQASAPLAFEQAREQARAACQAQMALKLVRETGEKNQKEISAMLAQGQTFEQAVAKLKLKTKIFKGFNGADKFSQDAFENSVRETAFPLPAGSLSAFIAKPYGGLFAYITSREAIPTSELAKIEPLISERLLQMEQQRVLQDFQQALAKEALGDHPPSSNSTQESE